MKKRLLSLILAGVLCSAMLAGCGSEPAEETSSSDFDYGDEYYDDEVQGRGSDLSDQEMTDEEAEAFLDGIVGEWVYVGDMDPADLSIFVQRGRYYYTITQSGESMTGTVELTGTSNPDGTTTYWFSFYEDDDYLWESFAVNLDVLYPGDLYSGQDGAIHFVRDTGSYDDAYSYTGDEGRGDVMGIYFVGTWKSADGYEMEVTQDDDNEFHVLITSPLLYDEVCQWEYFTFFDDDNEFLFCDDGIKYVFPVEDGDLGDGYIEYDDGSVNFVLGSDGMYWANHNEVEYQGMVFTYVSD